MGGRRHTQPIRYLKTKSCNLNFNHCIISHYSKIEEVQNFFGTFLRISRWSLNQAHKYAWNTKKKDQQAGTELDQAQLKLGLDFALIFCRFGFSPFGLIKLVWLNRFGLVYLVFYISKILPGWFSLQFWFGKFSFGLVELVGLIWFCRFDWKRFGLVNLVL